LKTISKKDLSLLHRIFLIFKPFFIFQNQDLMSKQLFTILFAALLLPYFATAQTATDSLKNATMLKNADEAAQKMCVCARPMAALVGDMEALKDKPEEMLKRMGEFEKVGKEFEACIKIIEDEYRYKKDDVGFENAVKTSMEKYCKEVTDAMTKASNSSSADSTEAQDTVVVSVPITDKKTLKEAKNIAKDICKCDKAVAKLQDEIRKTQDPEKIEKLVEKMIKTQAEAQICTEKVSKRKDYRADDPAFSDAVSTYLIQNCGVFK
jgi:hypothetical protein